MGWKHIGLYILLGAFCSCHAPLLLSGPDNQPKEKYRYYRPGYRLPPNGLLRTDGYYYAVWSPRKVELTLERYKEAKKNGISPSGFDMSKMHITKDTVLTVISTHVYIFYPNGSFMHQIFSNQSFADISARVEAELRTKREGGSFYKIDGDKIYYERYSRMSGFFYNQGILGKNSITVGKSEPYRFVPFKEKRIDGQH